MGVGDSGWGEDHYKEKDHVEKNPFTPLPTSLSTLHFFYLLQPTFCFPAASCLYTCSFLSYLTKLVSPCLRSVKPIY